MRTPRQAHRRFVQAGAAASVIVIIGTLMAACDDGADAPASAGTPAAASTPTPPRADATVAARLRYEGETEAAIEAYAAVAADSNGEQQQRARLALAQLQRADDRHDDAAATAGAWLADVADGAGAPAALLRADALAAAGDDAAALAAYEAYIAANPAMAPFASASRALILARTGNIAEATAGADAVIASDIALVENGFLYDMGESFEQAGADTEALDWYGRAVGAYDSPGGLSRRGAILQRIGDPAWAGEYLSLLKSAPASPLAIDALDALDAAGVPVPSFDRAFVLYRAFRNDDARAAFEQAVSENYAAASATYYLGALDERDGEFARAIDRYGEAYALDPDASTSDDALWWRGKLLEADGRHTEAAQAYAALAAEYPASEFAADAAFQRGLALYRNGDESASAETWGALASASDGHDRARALFWQARADASQRDAIIATLTGEHADDFYALLAAAEASANDDDDGDPDFSLGVDWDEIDTFISGLATADPSVTPTPVGAPDIIDARLAIAQQLDEAGRVGRADGLYAEILGDHDGEPYALFRLARDTAAQGRTSISARAATLLLASLPDGVTPPGDLLRAAYPPAYADLLLDAAKEQKIDPLLLMALMRQESFYDPRAGSSAGALGLTQVIEPTGEAIAADLGIADFALTDLFRPRLSLRFGASYLADQLDTFDGNAYHALAAYNGGPGAASKAIEIAGDDDPALFTEDLEFEETRRYVRLVMEHYARYRQAYLGLDAPSLPDAQ